MGLLDEIAPVKGLCKHSHGCLNREMVGQLAQVVPTPPRSMAQIPRTLWG